jgi:hypothetical protein
MRATEPYNLLVTPKESRGWPLFARYISYGASKGVTVTVSATGRELCHLGRYYLNVARREACLSGGATSGEGCPQSFDIWLTDAFRSRPWRCPQDYMRSLIMKSRLWRRFNLYPSSLNSGSDSHVPLNI